MTVAAQAPIPSTESLSNQVRSAVIWRSGSQILAQLVQWAATFLVIRILNPHDYGLFAMTGVVLVFLNMLNGYGLASGLIQKPEVTTRDIRQLFGMLLLLNGLLAAAQIFILAPAAAAYYRQPIVAHMLQVQALLYATTPFIALPYALLSRTLDFKLQARVNILASIASASAALGGALAGFGVWTLVFAPLVLFGVRAVGMTIAAKSLVWPSFDFRGSGTLARYGGVMAVGQLFWFAQSQADVFIAGRHFSPHELGLYSESLFLTQVFVSKFVPLNEVAFSAYARIQHDSAAVAAAFDRSVRIVMLAALPFYFGLAATARPLVDAVLGDKWAGTAPIVHLLALAMPFMTLQVLLQPACDARGRPGIGVGNGAFGAVVLASGFLVAVQWGATGLATAWILTYPIYLGFSLWRSLPVIGTDLRRIARAISPALCAAIAMALSVTLVAALLPPLPDWPELAILVTVGAVVYAGWLLVFSRRAVRELIAVVRKQPIPA